MAPEGPPPVCADNSAPPTADALRATMVAQVLRDHCTTSTDVERVLRHVPRHLFLPGTPLAEAYAPSTAVVTKRGPDGSACSSASSPSIVATMLDQLDVRRGHRVLEIGAGTGYNAALLAELVGATGRVATVDIDPDTTARARRALARTGYGHVDASTGDGQLGRPEHAPYDRIVVTAGAWDLPTAWIAQLAPGGRLVVPLRWRGQTHSVAFDREPDGLRSVSAQVCGFIPMVGDDGEQVTALGPDAVLAFDEDQRIDPVSLEGVLATPAVESWSGVPAGGDEPFTNIWLRITVDEPTACFLTRGGGVRPPRTPAIAGPGALAYLAYRKVAGASEVELGAVGHGPGGPALAARIVRAIHAWDGDRARQPLLTAHPADAPGRSGAGTVIVKRHVRLVLSG